MRQGGTDRGAAYIYRGTSTGIGTTPDTILDYEGTDNTAFFGYSAASSTDVYGKNLKQILLLIIFTLIAALIWIIRKRYWTNDQF